MIFNPNVCGCTGSYSNPPCPTSTLANCLRLCNLTGDSDTSVGPCNEAGTMLFEDKFTIPTGCTPEYIIVSHTDNLKDVAITTTGLTFVSDWAIGKDYIAAEIQFKVYCGNLSDIKTAYIFFSKGDKLNCDPGFIYNPCTGNCDAENPNISLGEGNNTDSNLSLS